MTFPVVLKSREGKIGVIKPEDSEAVSALGMELEELNEEVLEELDLQHGILVKSVGDGKLARLTEIRAGFIITRLNDTPVKSVKTFNELLKSKRPGELIILSGAYKQNPKREYNYAFRK